MSSALLRQLKLLVEVSKDVNKYQVKEIISDLEKLQDVMSNLQDVIDQKIKLNISGIKDIKDLQSAASSLNRTLGPVSGKLKTFFGSINNGTKNLNVMEVINLNAALVSLFQAINQLSIGTISKSFDDFVKSILKISGQTQNIIKPFMALENSIDSLDKKMKSSLATFESYANLFQKLETASGNVGANTKGARTPVFKTAESDASSLVGQYKKISTEINNAGVSLAAFAKNSSLIKDAGFRETLKGDIKTVTKNYSELQGVVAKLDATIQFLSADEIQNASALKVLRGASADASKEQAKLNEIQKQAISANEALERSVRENKDAHNAMFNTLGGVIKRQIEFVASATLLASSFDFVRRGFTSAFEIMSEVQRILVVSRSDFLTTADTVKLLTGTIETFATKTGESTQNIATVLKELGSAGLTTEQSVAALDSTLNNIIATDSSVTETTRLVASTYSILGNTVAGTSDQVSNFTRINDVLARATNESSLELDQLVQALKFSLPASKEAGLRFEDLVGILAQLADQGLKGGNAGRALRAALQQISKDAPAFAKAFNIDIPLDKPLQFLDIIQKFGDRIKGQDISAEELGTIFTRLGLRGADSFLLLGQGIDSVNRKISDLKNNSEGVAEIGAQIKIEGPERQFDILSQNINQLSREIFKPFIEAFISALKEVNKLSESIRLMGENVVFKISAQLAVFAGIIKTVGIAMSFAGINAKSYAAAITFLSGRFPALAAGIGATSGALVSLNAVLGTLGIVALLVALGAAIYSIIAANTDWLKSSELIKKELEDQRTSLQSLINENNKVADSFDKVSDRLIKNAKNYALGSITYEELLNDLNNISSSSSEAASVINAYGEDILGAANAIRELGEARKIANKALIDEQNIISKKSFDQSNKDFDEQIKKYYELTRSIKILEETSSNIGKIDFQKKELEDTIKKIRELNNIDLTLASKTNDKNLIQTILAYVKARKDAIGDITGIGNNISVIPEILTEINKRSSEIDFNKANFSIKEFENLINQASNGVEALSKKILFDFKVVVPDSFINDYNNAIAGLDVTVATKQINQSFLNNLNIQGISDVFQKQLRSLNLNIQPKAITDIFDGIIQSTSGIERSTLRTAAQYEKIKIIFDDLFDKQASDLLIKQKATKNIGEQKIIETQINDSIEQKKKFDIEIVRLAQDTARSKQVQLAAAIQQAKTTEAQLFSNRILNLLDDDSEKIIRDTVKSSEQKLHVSGKTLEYAKEQLENLKKQIVSHETEKANSEKVLGLEKLIAGTQKEITSEEEHRRILILKINTDLKVAQKSLQAQRSVGSDIVDQGRNRLEDIKDEVKLIEDKLILGYNEDEIKTELLKKDKETLSILQQISKEKLNDLTSIQSVINVAREEVSVHGDRLRIINNYKQAQLVVAKTEFEIANLGKKNSSNIETINKLEQKRLSDLVNLAKATKDYNKLELISIDNQNKLLELSSRITEKQLGLFADQKTKLGDNLKKLIEKNFEKNDFNETLKISNALNLSMTETFGLFGDSSKKSDAFFRALEKGTINLSGYSDEIQEAGRVYQELNKQAKDFRKQQQQINEDKFKLFEASFANAVSVGGKEGFAQAETALNSLIGLADVYSENGEKDNVKTLEKLQTIAKLREQITKIDVNATGLEKSPELVDKIKSAVEGLNEEFKRTQTILSEMKINDFESLTQFAARVKEILSSSVALESNSLVPKKFATGGIVPGVGPGDTVPAMLTPGEFVIPKDIVNEKGLGFFYDLIGGKPAKGYALGGLVRGYENGGIVEGSTGTEQIARILAVIAGSSSATAKNTRDILSPDYTQEIKDGLKLTNFRLEYISKFLANDYNVLTRESIKSTNNIEEKLDELNFFIPSLTRNVAKQTTLETLVENSEETNNILRTGLIIYNPNIDKMSVELEKMSGNKVATFATGGIVPGTGNKDSVPAMLTPGEFVIPKVDTKKLLNMNKDLNVVKLTSNILKKISSKIEEKYSKELAGVFNSAIQFSGINNRAQQASFLAQLDHESFGFTRLLESGSGSKYEGNLRLGNTMPGDGQRYKGRGFIQLTGRDNYRIFGKKTGLDLLGNPDLAAQPSNAAAIAVSYFKSKGLFKRADEGEYDKITKSINSGLKGKIDRDEKLDKIIRIFSEESKVAKFASGGKVPGVGSGDTIPALLTPGEFVIPKRIVEQKGLRYFEELIGGSNPKIGSDGIMRMFDGGPALNNSGPIMQSNQLRAENNSKSLLSTLFKDNQEVLLDILEQQKERNRKAEEEFKELEKLPKHLDKIFEIQKKQLDVEKIKSNAEKLNNPKEFKFPEIGSGSDYGIKNFLPEKIDINKPVLPEDNEGILKISKEAVKINDRLIDSFHKLEGSFIQAYDSYRDQIKKSGKDTVNFFLKISVRAADRFLDSIENIGNEIEYLFSRQLPGFLTDFVNNVVLSNVKILTDYKKQRIEIGKNYKNQRADLIEQLKRNEISYFDFFDKLEDLKKDQNKTEIELEIKKREELEGALRDATKDIANQIASIVGGIGSAVGSAFAGLPAIVAPFIDSISKGLAAAFGGVGALAGDALDIAANFIGPVIGAAGELFSIAFQGFASLIPLVTEIVTAPQAEFEQFLSSIQEIPAELDKILFGFTDEASGVIQTGIIDRIPQIADAFAENVIPIGEKFAEAIDKTFPLIAQAFSKIIPSALFAIIPVITSIFETLPDFLLNVFLATSTQLPAFAALFIRAAESFFNFFNTNLPRMIDGIIGFAETFVNTLVDYLNAGGIEQIVNSFETLGPQIANIVSNNAPEIAGALSSGVGVLAGALANEAPQIGSSIIDGINKIISGNGIEKMKSIFTSLFEKLFESLNSIIPTLIPIIGKILGDVFNLVVTGLKAGNQIADVFLSILSVSVSKIPEIIQTFIQEFSKGAPDIINGLIDQLVAALNVLGDSDIFSKIFQTLFSGDSLSGIFDKIVGFISSNIPKIVDSFSKAFTPARVGEIVNAFISAFSGILKSTGLNALSPVFTIITLFVQTLIRNKGALDKLISSIVKFGNKIFELGFKIFSRVGNAISKLLAILSKPGFTKIIERIGRIFTKVFDAMEKISDIRLLAILIPLTAIFEKLTEVLDRIITRFIENEQLFNLLILTLDRLSIALVFVFDNFGPLIDLAIPALVFAIIGLMAIGFAPLILIFGATVIAIEAVILVLDAMVVVMDLIEQFKEPIELFGKGIFGLIVVIGILMAIAIFPLVAAFILIFGPALAFHALLLTIVVAIGILVASMFTLEDIITILTAAFVAIGVLAILPFIAILAALLAVFLLISAPVIIATAVIAGLIVAMGLFIDNLDSIGESLNNAKNTILSTFERLITGLINSVPGAAQIAENQPPPEQNKIGADQEEFGIVKEAKEGFKKLFGFEKGGLVGKDGISGTEKYGPGAIPIVAHKGEFVLNRKTVSKIGASNLDKLNNDSASFIPMMNQISGISATISSGKQQIPEIPENANTREYYLKNFYNPGDSGTDVSSSPNTNINSPDSGISSSSRSSIIGGSKNNKGKGIIGKNSDDEGEGIKATVEKIEFKIDLSGSNFTSEDAAEKVKRSIIEELDNNKGALAGKLRDMINKGGK